MTIILNGSLSLETLKPKADNSYDVGTASLRWRNGYFASDIFVADGKGLQSESGARIATGGGGGTFQTKAGSATSDAFAANIYDGTQVFRIISDGTVVSRKVRPMTDTSYSLGDSSYRWTQGHFANGGTTLFLYGTTSNASGAANPQVLIKEDGQTAYWALIKRGSSYSDPDALLFSYYDGSSWYEALRFTKTGAGYLSRDPYYTKKLYPISDNTYDLGSSSYRWHSGFFSYRVFAGTPSSGTHRGVFIGSDGNIELWRGDDGVPYIDFKTDYSTDYDARIQKTSTHELKFYTGGSGSIVNSLTLAADGVAWPRHVYPQADNTYSLGSSSYRWKYGYFSSTLQASQLKATSVITLFRNVQNSNLRVTGGDNFSFTSDGIHGSGIVFYGRDSGVGDVRIYAFNGLQSDGTTSTSGYIRFYTVNQNGSGTQWAYFNTDGSFRPGTDSTYNLGSGSLRWNTLYVKNISPNAAGLKITVDDSDFIVQDSTDSTTNYIWRDHSASALYLGTSAAKPTFRYHVYPNSDGAYDIGSSSARFRHFYITGNIYTYGTAPALIMDYDGSSGNLLKRITCNDGGGNFNIRAGCYYSSGEKYAAANSGAVHMQFTCDSANGKLLIRCAPKSTNANDAVSYTTQWEINSSNIKHYDHTYPSSDNAIDLGSSSLRWRNIHCVNMYYGDAIFENGWKLSEAEKYGLDEGVVLVSPEGRVFKLKLEEVEAA